MHRRRFLAATAATVGAAGCLGGTGPGTPEKTPTTSATPTPSADGMGESRGGLTVQRPRVYRSIASPGRGSTHIDVLAPEGAQFLVVTASMDGGWGETDPTDALRLVLDGEAGFRPSVVNAFGPRSGYVELGFEVPVATYESGYVEYESSQWAVPDEALDGLAAPPEFEVSEFTVPDSVERHDAIPVSFTVANTGDRDGRFLAEFGAAVISDVGEMTLGVAAGAETTHEELVSVDYWEDMDSIPVVLDWGRDRIRKEVPVSDE